MLVGAGPGRAGELRAPGYGWRLVGGNNHELGRSPAPAPTVEDCRASVLRLKAGAGSLNARVRSGTAAAAWMWTVELDGAPAAVSGRGYQRQRECRYSLDHFLAAIPQAEIARDWRAPVVDLVMVPATDPVMEFVAAAAETADESAVESS